MAAQLNNFKISKITDTSRVDIEKVNSATLPKRERKLRSPVESCALTVGHRPVDDISDIFSQTLLPYIQLWVQANKLVRPTLLRGGQDVGNHVPSISWSQRLGEGLMRKVYSYQFLYIYHQ